jgi:hypothetical protein
MVDEFKTGRTRTAPFKLSRTQKRAIIELLNIDNSTRQNKADLNHRVAVGIAIYLETKQIIEQAPDPWETRKLLKRLRQAAIKNTEALSSLDKWGLNLLGSQSSIDGSLPPSKLIVETEKLVTKTENSLKIIPRKRARSINRALKIALVQSLAMAYERHTGARFILSEKKGQDRALKFVTAVVNIVEPSDDPLILDQNIRSIKEAMKEVIKERRAAAKEK